MTAAVLSRALRRLGDFFLPAAGTLRLSPWLVVAAAGGVAGVGVASSDTAQRLEWATYDRLLRSATNGNAAAPGIAIVAIDEPSATELGRPWPWPREWHARLVEQLAQGGARAIVLDVVFEGPGPDPEGDASLARAIRKAGNVVLASDLVETADRAYHISQWVEPSAAIREAAAVIGAARVTPDPDGVVRRTALVVEGRRGLALAAATVTGLAEPADPARTRLVGYNGPPRLGVGTVSYYQALQADTLLPSRIFEGKVVFVGRALSIAADTDVPDHYPTPIGQRTPGVEIHASIYDTLARDREVRDPFGDLSWQAAALLALALVGGTVLRPLSPAAGLVGLVAGGLALLSCAWLSLTWTPPFRVPVLAPTLTLAATYATTAAYRYAVGARERLMIRRAFQHYVSPAVVDVLLRDPAKLKLGGEDCDVTVLFTDLEGFTSFSERLGPEEVRAHLSEHFTAMVDALLDQRATLDKFIGDSVMAYFGAPLPDADHPRRACSAALQMQARMAGLSARWAAAGMPRVGMRIGINTGRVVAGNMGTAAVFNYTVIGDTVNLASRLEGVNKVYGTGIIVGDRTRAEAGDAFAFRELDVIRVQGRAQPVAVHELLGRSGEVDGRRLELARLYSVGLAHYRARDWPAAQAAFRAALEADASDGPSAAMLKRAIDYATRPPGEGWEGVFDMHGK